MCPKFALRKTRFYPAIIFILVIISTSTEAIIINVPVDQPLIQSGIDSASSGDTVLVQPGNYLENINFSGKNIVVASPFLTTGDTSFISSTIIDGGATNAVVRIESGEDSTAAIIGFTITGGIGWKPTTGSRRGGGIYCRNSEPLIMRNKIIDNSAGYGGGIFCDTANPTIFDNIITRNEGSNSGGGIWCFYSAALIKNNIIYDNIANSIGGGIIGSFSNATIINNTITSNYARNSYSTTLGGGAIYFHGESFPVLTNNIIWRNHDLENNYIWIDTLGAAQITYCLIEGGWPGEGNIDADPLFAENNYNVCSASPSLDAGDPNLFDPDSSRSDIGFYFDYHPECTFGKISYVSPSGNDITGDGSIGNPYETIQYAVDRSLSGDTIVALNGTYIENINIKGKDVLLTSNFVFTNDTLDILNTIIDGDSVDIVVNIEGCDSSASLTGFTITNGYSQSGSGVRCFFADPLINSNRIINNCAELGSGGMTVLYSSPIIENNIIDGNQVQPDSPVGQSGGIYFYRSPAILSNNIISNNFAGKLGGGIYCLFSDLVISGNVFHGNTTDGTGGGIALHISNSIISGNTIVNNSAADKGGGIYCSSTADPAVSNTIFWNNTADSGMQIYLNESSEASFSDCIIEGGWASGVGIILDNPLFCDTANNDFHIRNSSPAAPENSNSGELIGALGVGCFAHAGPVWYVTVDGNDITGDGAAGNPFSSVQLAVDNSKSGDTILIGPGTYNENITLGGHNITVGSMFLITGDTIHIPSTIIDGGMNDAVFTIIDGEDSTAMITGLTITNGRGFSYFGVYQGGGIYCENSSPVISHNHISGNGVIEWGDGGGINLKNADATITDNIIRDNHVRSGGGIRCIESNALIVNNIIENNSAASPGGGIVCSGNSNATITGNIIKNNYAGGIGGGGMLCQESSPVISNNDFINNFSDGSGGAVLLRNNSNPVLNYNTIAYNQSSADGGGIACLDQSNIEITNNTIAYNVSDLSGGGLSFDQSGSIIANTIIWANQAVSGSQVWPGADTSAHIINYCDIQGGWPGEGNIDEEPFFCNPGDTSFTLADFSPCLGAGLDGADIGAEGEGCSTTDIAEIDAGDLRPPSFTMKQNYPNPFNMISQIEYSIPEYSEVSIDIYNILGQHIKNVVSDRQAAGVYKVSWDGLDKNGRDVASGLYFYKITAEKFTQTRKMLLLK